MTEESASLSSVVLTFSFDHTVLDIMLPVTQVSHIKEPPRETETSSEASRDKAFQRSPFFPLNSSPYLLSFLSSSLLSIKISSTAPLGGSIYHRFCLPGSAISDRLPKEHHSPPAISPYSLRGQARRNSAQRRLKTAERHHRESAYNPHRADINLSLFNKTPPSFSFCSPKP